ncbi:peptidase inhibitor 16 [Elysia marginata]|uniref:Peptidase inhibitor 16 n=1 Tax=Elysia marginata TaxID=1093978 RepID=A0AAV4H522_9GAST|nr:peptidase inhibitor 16 [Elysia marginata]
MVVIVMFLELVLLAITGCSVAHREEPLAYAYNLTAVIHRKFLNNRLGVRSLHRRVRRYTYDRSYGVNHEEAMMLLRKHNEYRSMQNSSNMLFMEWNYDLQELAQAYADKCYWGHSKKAYRKNVGGFKHVGENLYAGNQKFDINTPIKMWYDEIKDYVYETRYCPPGVMCGHYTQVVWHHSYALGCGITFCENLKNTRFSKGYYVVCHYGPAGNYIGRPPFKKGKACTDCDKEKYPFCIRGLCSSRPQIGSESVKLVPQATIVFFILSSLF